MSKPSTNRDVVAFWEDNLGIKFTWYQKLILRAMNNDKIAKVYLMWRNK